MRRSSAKLSSDCSRQSDVLSPWTYFTAPSLCSTSSPRESSPFLFLSEYESGGSQTGLAGPMLAGPEPRVCGRTVGEDALRGGANFPNGT